MQPLRHSPLRLRRSPSFSRRVASFLAPLAMDLWGVEMRLGSSARVAARPGGYMSARAGMAR